MKIIPLFNDFLQDIRLTKSQRDDLKRGHKTLRERLLADKDLAGVIISTFLQGSYRRSTAIRPVGDKRADVDVIVVTNIDKTKSGPQDAIDLFIPFMEKHYKGKYRLQGRSIGIELSYVDLDVVITSAPSEVDKDMYKSVSVVSDLMLEDLSSSYDWRLVKSWTEPDMAKAVNTLSDAVRKAPEWQSNPLWIPDRDAACWVETHPLEQIRWTREKNANTNRHYVNVVKALKWSRLEKMADLKYPKGYPIEHLIGNCCPDDITSIPEGVVKTLENIVTTYAWHRLVKTVPEMPDRGVPTHNVWKRISLEDFISYYDRIKEHASIARKAFEADTLKEQVSYWKELFGSKFPDASDDDDKRSTNNTQGGFSDRTAPSIISGGRFG